MNYITTPSITRLARKAGIKSMSKECYDEVKKICTEKIEEVIKNILLVNNTKTILISDFIEALELNSEFITISDNIGNNIVKK